jgi:hypothetical protein
MSEPEPLLAALQQWAQKVLPAPPSGHPGPECQWCPLCQLASVLRGEHPELTGRLAEAGTAVTTAVRALLDQAATRTPGRPSPTPDLGSSNPDVPSPGQEARAPGPDPTPPARPQPRPRVQRIVLDDETPKG